MCIRDRGRTDVFAQSDGLSGEGIESLFEDRENNIWVGTSNGLDRFRDFSVVTLTQKQGLSSAIVAAVLPDREGNIWFSTHGDLDRWNNGQTKTYPIHPESLFQDDRGRIWTSTSREFGYLEDGRFTSIEGVPGGNILSIAQDTAGNLWVANEPCLLYTSTT